MLIRTSVFNEIGDWFRIGNRQLAAGCRFELAFFKTGTVEVGDKIGFR